MWGKTRWTGFSNRLCSCNVGLLTLETLPESSKSYLSLQNLCQSTPKGKSLSNKHTWIKSCQKDQLAGLLPSTSCAVATYYTKDTTKSSLFEVQDIPAVVYLSKSSETNNAPQKGCFTVYPIVSSDGLNCEMTLQNVMQQPGKPVNCVTRQPNATWDNCRVRTGDCF